MPKIRSGARMFLGALAIAGVAGAAWRAGAAGAPAAVAPTAVASVDFNRVYQGLKEKADREERAGVQRAKYKSDLDAIKKSIESIAVDIEAAKPNSEERRRLVASWREAFVQGQVRASTYNQDLDFAAAQDARDLYMKFLATLDYLAKRDGWDLIIFDDRARPIPDPMLSIEEKDQVTPRMVSDAIVARTVLYVGPKADLTEQVISIMNNDYASGVVRTTGSP